MGADTFIEIEVAKKDIATNSFTAKYVLFAVGNLDGETEITSRPQEHSNVHTEIYSRALGIFEKETSIDIKYRGNLDALVEIHPIGSHNMPTEIEVRPHNKLMAIYEVQQPPVVTDIFNPTQDSFTREKQEFESINYGANSSMIAGINGDDIWRSYIQFDLSSINPSYILTESYLRLYYKGAIPTQIKLEILNADRAWSEYSITNLNRPNPIELITNEFTVNTQYGYIEFNVFDVVEDWVAQRIINNGFLVRLSNETQVGQAIFHTRESMLPPELIVKYYDSRIFSQSRSQFLTEIFIMKRDNSDILITIEPTSIFVNSDIDTEIYCHQVNVPLDSDILTEIIANIPVTESEITVSLRDESTTLAKIDVRLPEENSVHAEITASRDTVNSEITSAYRDNSEVDSELTATKPDINTEITVPLYGNSDKDVEIFVNIVFLSQIDTEITVSKENLPAEIIPRVLGEYDIYTVIAVSRVALEAEIEVKNASDILVEIEPNIKSDTLVSITASMPDTLAELGVYGYEELEELVEINIRVYNSQVVSQVDAEITINKPITHSEIVVPTWVSHDLPTEIQPRIVMVNNVHTVIQVGSKGGAYAFII